jgi:hypothetical protein
VLDGLLTDIPAADGEKDRLKTVKVVRHLLAGKHDRKKVVKYLLGIIETVPTLKGGGKWIARPSALPPRPSAG